MGHLWNLLLSTLHRLYLCYKQSDSVALHFCCCATSWCLCSCPYATSADGPVYGFDLNQHLISSRFALGLLVLLLSWLSSQDPNGPSLRLVLLNQCDVTLRKFHIMSVWCSISISYMSAIARITICECEKQLESVETLMRRYDEPDSAESRAKLGFWCRERERERERSR